MTAERRLHRALPDQVFTRPSATEISPAATPPTGTARHDAPPPGDPSRRAATTPRAASRRKPPRDADAPKPLRLFVALDLPDAVRDALAALGAAADQDVWRPVAREALHVTLAFLGSRPPEDVATIAPVVAAEHAAPHLALGDVLLLPRRGARVLTVALADPTNALTDLQARIATALADRGVYTPEKRPFRPHVTVARLRPRTRPPRTASLQLDPRQFSATAVTLYASRLHPSGARYEALARAALG